MAKAGRIFFPLDVNWYDEWGLLVSSDAAVLWVIMVCLSKRIMSDGILTMNQIRKNAPEALFNDPEKLAAAVAELTDTPTVPLDRIDERHVEIRGWLTWNTSADDIEAMSIGGEYGNHVKWHVLRKQKPKSPCSFCGPSGPDIGGRVATRVGDDIAETETETETETEVMVTRKSRLPSDFGITTKMKEWASKNGFEEWVDIEDQTQLFKDHHLSKGSLFIDWTKAWQTWIRKAAQWAKERGKTKPKSFVDEKPAGAGKMFQNEEEREAFYSQFRVGPKVSLDD